MIERGYCGARGRRHRRTAIGAGGFPGRCCPTSPTRTRSHWWLAKRRYLVDELGVDGFKTDGGEHAWGDDLRYADGTRGDERNNRFPVLYAEAYHRCSTGRR